MICPLCESKDLKPAFDVHYWRENLFHFVDCSNCGATFVNPMPSDDVITQGNNALVRFYQKDRTLDQEFREGRQAYLRGKLFGKKLLRWKKRGRVLELGCYHGFFSLGIKDHTDWTVEGLEISNELCQFVKNTLGIPCFQGTLENANLPENAFDFIICHDLIEHINQPKAFLKQLYRILAPSGRIQIITPNARQDLAYTRRAAQVKLPLTMLLNHIFYFRTKTLLYALNQANLKPLKLYCYDVRYTPKDLGWFGLGKPDLESPEQSSVPSIQEALKLPERKTLSIWTQDKLNELRHHPKTSLLYGFFKETLPRAMTLPIPANLELGHEIYALAEKQVGQH